MQIVSSYAKNNFGEVFENIVKATQPRLIVELGVLNGYSTYHICKGLNYNKETFGTPSKFDAYDLWDDYKFKHGNMEQVRQMLDESGFQDFVTLHKEDAYKVHERYADRSVYLLHVDISNTGETVRRIMELWDPKMVHDGIILFEGGSVERDNVEWMKKYNMPSIRKELRDNPIINYGVGWYACGTYNKFPSLTFLLKRFDQEHQP